MNTAGNMVRSSVARVFHALAAIAVGFFMMPFLVRSLGEYWYGIWTLISGLASNYYLLDMGLSIASTRFVSRAVAEGDTEGVNVIVNTSLVIYTLLGVVVAGTALGVAACVPAFVAQSDARTTIQAAIVMVGFQFAGEFPVKALAGIIATYLRFDLLIYARLANLCLSSVSSVILIRMGFGIVALAASNLLFNSLSNVAFFLVARHLFPAMRLRYAYVRRGIAHELIGYSKWAFLVQIADQLRFRVDSAVVGSRVSVAAVTYYAVPQRLVDSFVDMVYRATHMMTPVFTRYYVENRWDEIRTKLLLMTRVNAIIAMFGGGLVLIVGDAFIERWMGPRFGASYPILIALMIGRALEVTGCHVDSLLYALAKQRTLALINLSEGVANLGLSIGLASSFGLVGVAIGTLVPLVCVRLVAVPIVLLRYAGIGPLAYFGNLAPVGVFTIAYLLVYRVLVLPSLVGATFLGILGVAACSVPVYACAIPFVVFGKAERQYLWGQLMFMVRGSASRV